MIKSLKEKGYRYLIYASYLFYIISFLGISLTAPSYHRILTEIIKVYVSILLIYNFNPWGKKECSKLDKDLAFSAAIFLIFTTILGETALFYTNNIINDVKK